MKLLSKNWKLLVGFIPASGTLECLFPIFSQPWVLSLFLIFSVWLIFVFIWLVVKLNICLCFSHHSFFFLCELPINILCQFLFWGICFFCWFVITLYILRIWHFIVSQIFFIVVIKIFKFFWVRLDFFFYYWFCYIEVFYFYVYQSVPLWVLIWCDA